MTPEKSAHDFFGLAHSAGHAGLCKVVRVQTRDVILLSAGQHFLRLHDLYGVSDTRGEAISRLREFVFGEFAPALRDANLFRGGRKIQVGGPDLCFDLGTQVVIFCAAPL